MNKIDKINELAKGIIITLRDVNNTYDEIDELYNSLESSEKKEYSKRMLKLAPFMKEQWRKLYSNHLKYE